MVCLFNAIHNTLGFLVNCYYFIDGISGKCFATSHGVLVFLRFVVSWPLAVILEGKTYLMSGGKPI